MTKKESNKTTLKWIYARIKKYLPLITAVSVVTALSACTGVGIALVTKQIFDIATKDSQGSILFAGIILFIIIAAQVLLSAVQSFLSAYAGGKLTVNIRHYLFSVLLKKKYSSLSAYHSGDLLNRFTSDTETVVSNSVTIIPSITSIVTKIVTGIGAMLILNPYLAVIILLLGIAVPAIGRVINKRYKQLHKDCQKTEGKTRAFLQECFENIVVIKSFVSEAPFKTRLGFFMDENFKIKMRRTSISVLMHICLYSFFTVGYYAVLVWGAGGISAGSLTYGTLMAFLQLISQLRAPLQNVSGIIPKYYAALASAERLMELEESDDERAALEESKMKSLKADFRRLEINDVCFSYGGDIILENCSFAAEKGRIIALTGESGSGKSTLFKIILGLYEPQSGSITVNGETEVNSSVRGLFSYVPQGNMVLSGTIKDNITLCNSDIDEEKIIKAAKAAEIYDYIVSLQDGFDTVLSERGAGLSEGQLQRISIARALLADAPVLLLDEATSALDEATETKVLDNIKNMTDKTVLFITHRNTRLKVCDRIVRVEDKKFTVIK